MSVALEEHKLNLVLDVKVQLTVRLGSCELPMREMLELGPGAIIQLSQRANDPVGLYVNEKLRPTLQPAFTGWFGHARPFAFEPGPITYAEDRWRLI